MHDADLEYIRKKSEGDNVIGYIRKSENRLIVIRLSKFKGELGVDIRIFDKSLDSWTKSGARIPIEKWAEFKKVLGRVPY